MTSMFPVKLFFTEKIAPIMPEPRATHHDKLQNGKIINKILQRNQKILLQKLQLSIHA